MIKQSRFSNFTSLDLAVICMNFSSGQWRIVTTKQANPPLTTPQFLRLISKPTLKETSL